MRMYKASQGIEAEATIASLVVDAIYQDQNDSVIRIDWFTDAQLLDLILRTGVPINADS